MALSQPPAVPRPCWPRSELGPKLPSIAAFGSRAGGQDMCPACSQPWHSHLLSSCPEPKSSLAATEEFPAAAPAKGEPLVPGQAVPCPALAASPWLWTHLHTGRGACLWRRCQNQSPSSSAATGQLQEEVVGLELVLGVSSSSSPTCYSFSRGSFSFPGATPGSQGSAQGPSHQ